MQEDRIFLLPDEALYHLLTVVPLKYVVSLEETYGKARSEIFAAAKIYAAKEYDLPEGLTFQQMYELSLTKDPDIRLAILLSFGDSARKLGLVDDVSLAEYKRNLDVTDYALDTVLEYGDFPAYTEFVFSNLEDPNLAAETVVYYDRVQSLLVFLNDGGYNYQWLLDTAIKRRAKKCAEVLIEKIDFQETVKKKYMNERGYRYESDNEIWTNIAWMIDELDLHINADFILTYLSYAFPVNFEFLETLFAHTTKEELQKVYEELDSLKFGLFRQGSKYLIDITEEEKRKITNLLRKYLKK